MLYLKTAACRPPAVGIFPSADVTAAATPGILGTALNWEGEILGEGGFGGEGEEARKEGRVAGSRGSPNLFNSNIVTVRISKTSVQLEFSGL